jgi:predicted membrane protein
MDKEEFEKRIEERWGGRRGRRGRHRNEKGRVWGGLFMLIIGTVLLLKVSGTILFPGWLFTWPVLLIAIGLFSGAKHRFRGIGWLFPLAIGAIFLADDLSPDMQLRPYLWPMLLIAAGLFVIFRPKHRRCRQGEPGDDDFDKDKNFRNEAVIVPNDSESARTDWQKAMPDSNDTIDATAVFGSVKKNVLSKTFKGGDITAFMGGAEINLTQADFNGRAAIDCFNMFGGTKLIIPPDWEVQSDVMAIFGGVDDKRPPAAGAAPAKVLYLDGTCIFGGLEIKSY